MDEFINREKAGFGTSSGQSNREHEGHLKDVQGIQIEVVSNGGMLQELYIPYDSDGIHKVFEQSGKDVLLQIRKQNHEWVAICGAMS